MSIDYQIIHSDCLEAMKSMADNSIDFCVTDPPYGLKFLGKKWDYNVPDVNLWKELLRILKPGSMIAVFGGSRTYHRMVLNIEDAGFEIRDCIMWIYGSGFPKSHNFGRNMNDEWKGYGTALKPAHEPICIAMKPLKGTFIKNAEKWGVAGINIDDSRIDSKPRTTHLDGNHKGGGNDLYESGLKTGYFCEGANGRWPANIIFDEEAAQELDKQSGIKNPIGGSTKGFCSSNRKDSGYKEGDSGGASRFFYCAKASPSERNGSTHPTMKPLSLMKYIIKLLAPPGKPLLIDPFLGSGSILVAAKEMGIRGIGIEKEEEYVEIARKRLENSEWISEQFEMSFSV